MAYNCYLTLGPFSIGYFVPQQIGASFSFGLYTGGAYIEEATTYLYVAIHLLWFTSVTMFCVGEILLRGGGGGRGGAGPLSLRGAGFKLLWCFVVVVQLYSMNSYRMAYGWLASGTNLVSTWSLVFFVYLISKAGRISRLSNTSPARRPVNWGVHILSPPMWRNMILDQFYPTLVSVAVLLYYSKLKTKCLVWLDLQWRIYKKNLSDHFTGYAFWGCWKFLKLSSGNQRLTNMF